MIFEDFSDVRIIDGARIMYRKSYFPKYQITSAKENVK